MRYGLIVLWMLLCSITSAAAQVSVGIGLPGVSIGFSVPVYPQLVRVPNYPVYYAPQMNSNYFFYDGMYWVYEGDNWYASSWYNGPWALVAPEVVPLFILRVPVRYYRHPPAYFHAWRSDAPPRWGEHWGGGWEQSHRGWDSWNRSAVPAPAPLPSYQRQYSGNRYPPVAQQQALQSQNYRYQPRDAVVQQHYQGQRAQSAPTQAAPAAAPRGPQAAPEARSPQRGGQPAVQQAEQPARATAQRQQQASKAQVQDKQPQAKAAAKEPKQAQAQQPPKAAAQHQQQPKAQQSPQAAVQRQQPPKAEAQDRQPHGKAPASEQKKGKEKDGEKIEQRGG
jgi:hypothetical protein